MPRDNPLDRLSEYFKDYEYQPGGEVISGPTPYQPGGGGISINTGGGGYGGGRTSPFEGGRAPMNRGINIGVSPQMQMPQIEPRGLGYGGGGGGSPLPQLGQYQRGPVTGSGPTGMAAPQGGMSGWEKAAIIASGLGAAGNIYGAYKQGQALDKEMEMKMEEARRERRAARAFAPILQRLMQEYQAG